MFNCEKCNKSFTRKYNLDTHLNKKISCDNTIKCTICNKIFKTNQILTNHLNRKNKCIKQSIEEENIELKEEIKTLQEENRNLKNNTYIKYNIIGYVYIVSNLCYELQDIYKIGQTFNKDTRLSAYNTGLMLQDKFRYIYIIETEYFIELEQLIFKYLEKYKVNNEMYKLKLLKIKNLIEKLNIKLIAEKEIKNLNL